jgi:hypothetical protein
LQPDALRVFVFAYGTTDFTKVGLTGFDVESIEVELFAP